ncbi:uncharacterized protein LOC135338142 isoform X2 [Halichondria panicea]|uniref:uncharacterized protein LOC135338142 isoform X2 n=1 Tax=Halichondria panicea TaxID=6063 RepID=UPI00312B8CB9
MAMDAEVTILQVEEDTEIVCLSGTRRKSDESKGKGPANPSKRIVRKRHADDVITIEESSPKQQCPSHRDSLHHDTTYRDGPSTSSHTILLLQDEALARQLQEQDCAIMSSNNDRLLEDEAFAKKLQTADSASGGSSTCPIVLQDEQLALTLQEEEFAFNTNTLTQIKLDAEYAKLLILKDKDKTLSTIGLSDATPDVVPTPQRIDPPPNTLLPPRPLTPVPPITPLPPTTPVPTNTRLPPTTPLDRLPKCWTACPTCKPTDSRRYHLIEVAQSSSEWKFVSDPLTQANFTVGRVQRIQNESLWERLSSEKSLMLRQRDDVNMQLLYHTSRAQPSVICEEGLDNRLSRDGNFGKGIYFSDNPAKCDGYSGGDVYKKMFLCRVLMGHIKSTTYFRNMASIKWTPLLCVNHPRRIPNQESLRPMTLSRALCVGSMNSLCTMLIE